MNNLKKFGVFINENINEKEITKENVLDFWIDKWKGTCLEEFPNTFIDNFPTEYDYHEWEKSMYDYDSEDDEWEFSPEDEAYNIGNYFNVSISNEPTKDGDCRISEEDWVDFFNDMWSWENN